MTSSEIPSRTLFIADIPPTITESQFQELFSVYSGFKEARLRKDKNNNVVGFVEFENESCAGLGKAALQGYKWSLDDKGLLIQFSRSDAGGRKQRNSDNVSTYIPQHLPPHQQRRGPSMVPFGGIGQEFSPMMPQSSLLPEASSTLFVEGLPLDATEREVAHIFRRMPGFQSLRIIPKEINTPQQRTYNLCFVEFDNKYQSTAGLHHLQGYRLEKDDARTAINISFAKKRKKNGPPTNGTSPANNVPGGNNNSDSNPSPKHENYS